MNDLGAQNRGGLRPVASPNEGGAAGTTDGPVDGRRQGGPALAPAAVGGGYVGEASDEQLLSAHHEGDPKAFARLVKRYERELFLFLVRFLGNRASAEDVFQEAFLQVHQSAEQFDATRRFRPWLFTIAANKARDLLRSQSRRPTSPLEASISPGDDESGKYIDLMRASTELPDEPLAREEIARLVQRAVAQMPQHLREILLLSYFHGFAYKQISEILDIPLGTVKSRLHAAVAHFAEKWREANPDPSVS